MLLELIFIVSFNSLFLGGSTAAIIKCIENKEKSYYDYKGRLVVPGKTYVGRF